MLLKRVLVTFVALAVVCFIAVGNAARLNSRTSSKTNATGLDEEYDEFVPYQGDRFDIFDWDLSKKMSKLYTGNLLFSPIALKLALVLVYEGATGQTAQELSNAMQLPNGRPATRTKFSEILASLNNKQPNGPIVNLASRLYVDSTLPLRPRYSSILKMSYDTDVFNKNFSDPHSTTEEINNWIKNSTGGHIEGLIDDKDLKDSLMLVLNAMYFKGTWFKNPFAVNKTKTGKFHTKTGATVDVPFMNTVDKFFYTESAELDAKILRIPYQGHKYAMYFLLPRSMEGLDYLIQNINPYLLNRQMWNMEESPVEVSIPKFKFTFTGHMQDILRELGIRDIFDNTATLSGIAHNKKDSRNLQVSEVVQKTGIEVNEQGSTAYAATEVVLGNKISDQSFEANRPFVFYVEDETTGTILFMGKVTNPQEETGSTTEAKISLPPRFGEEEPQKQPNGDKLNQTQNAAATVKS